MSSSRYPPSVPPLALPGRSVISSNASSLQQSLQTSPEPARHSQSQVQSQTSTATQSQTSSLVGNPSQSDHVVTSKSTGLKPYNSPITQARPTQSKTQRATELADRGLVPYAAAPALQPQFTQASAAQQASPGIVPYQPYMPVQYMPPVAPMPMTPYFPMQPMYPSPYSYPVQPYSASPFQPPYPGQPVTPEVKVQQDFQKAIMCTAGLPIRGNKAPDNIPRLVEDQYGIRLVMPMKNMHLPSVEADKPLVDTRPPPELPARHATAVTQPGQTHYETLGVDPNCSEETILTIGEAKLARMQTRIEDPQSSANLRAAAKIIYNNLARAYEVLADPALRMDYDIAIGLVPSWQPAEDSDASDMQVQQSAVCDQPSRPNTPIILSKKSWKPERNPYDVLGVAENASMKDIENAYQSFHNAFLVDRPQLDELRLRYAQAQLAEKKKAFKFLMNPKYRQRYDRYLVYGDETSDADNDTSQVDESDEAISPPLAMTDDSDFAPRDRSAILSPEGNDDITAARHGQSGTARHPSHQLPNLELSLQSSDPKYADSEISHIDFGQKLQRPIYGQLDASKESGPMHITRATPVISPNSAHGNKSRPETPVRHSQRSAVKNGHKHEDSKIVIDNQAVTRRH